MSLASVYGAINMPARTTSPSSLSEAGSSLSAHGRRIPFSKSDMQINITNHWKSKTYTSSSAISGNVIITSQRDVRFDSVEIILLGGSKTRTEGYHAPHESTHTFLKLIMPISESIMPIPRVLEANRTLSVPFHFVLPTHLTLSACHHKVASDHVREQHLRLPPSMGAWARGSWEKDDLAPHMTEVVYSIKARVWRDPEAPRGRSVKIMEAVKPIQVMPASTEDAPLSISPADTLYKMSTAKTLRKNILASKLGALTVSAQQPRAIRVRPDGRIADARDSAAQLDLHFAPLAPDAHPPRIAAVSAKIIAHTYYSGGSVHDLPHTGDFLRPGLTERRGAYTTSVGVASMDGRLQPMWEMHRLSRRDSGYGSETASDYEQFQPPAPVQHQHQQPQRRKSSLANLIRSRPLGAASRDSSSGAVVHTASVQLPLTLPTAKRTFLPSFHSCIVSRVYTLHVSLTVDSGSGAAAATKLSLDLPVQIAVESSGGAGEQGEALPSWAEAVEEAEAVDAFLTPRVLGVLPEGSLRRRELCVSALPGYERRV